MYEGKTQLTRIWVVKPEFVNNWNEITEAHTKLLEKEIISKPQYWLWSHKRWKNSRKK